MEEFVLKAEPREQFGSRAARRLRQAGLLPANIYGHGEENASVTLDAGEFRSFFEAGHRVVTLVVEGRNERGVVKEVQYDSLGSEMLHVDFARVSLGETISMEIPIVTVGAPKGAAGGGILEAPLKELKIEGAASRLPESYRLNIEELKVGESIRVKELEPPPGCRFLDDPELVVVAVSASRAAPEREVAAEPGPAEPEVIGRKKEEDEERAESS